MKKFSKMLTIIAILMMVITNIRVVNAEDPTTPPEAGKDSKYAELSGTDKFTFYKYLVTNASQEIPEIEFTYTIEPGEAVPAEVWIFNGANYSSKDDAIAAVDEYNNADPAPTTPATYDEIEHLDAQEGKFEIYAGIGSPSFTQFAKFNANGGKTNTGKYTELQEGDTIDENLLTEGKQYSKEPVIIDFSSVNFTEPGIYRYIITEQKLSIQNTEAVEYDIELDGSMKRVLDVYVIDDPDGVLQAEIDGYVLHETVSEINMTENMGSKDANVVESGWAISDDLGTVYNSKEEAEKALNDRKSTGTEPTDFDQAILNKQEEINRIQEQLDSKQSDYDEQASGEGIPTKETDLANAEKALEELLTGKKGDEAPSKTIEELLKEIDVTYYREATSEETEFIEITAENQNEYHNKDGNTFYIGTKVVVGGIKKDKSAVDQTELEKHGRENLYNYLVKCTDAHEIEVLREVISSLDAKISAARVGVSNAKKALDDALIPLQNLLDEIKQLNKDKNDLQNELEELIKNHNSATVVAVKWKLKDKTDHYTNIISVYDLEFGKEVEGNQGSKDKYFKFTLTLEGLRKPEDEKWVFEERDYTSKANAEAVAITKVESDDTQDPVVWKYKDVTYPTKEDAENAAKADVLYVPAVEASVVTINESGEDKSIWTKAPTKTNSTNDKYTAEIMKTANSRDDDDTVAGQQLKADSDGKIVWTVYLKDGEYINIKDLPSGITYKVEETEEDYKKTDGTDKIAYDLKEIVEHEYWEYKDLEFEHLHEAKERAYRDIEYMQSTDSYIFNSIEYLSIEDAKAAVDNFLNVQYDETTNTGCYHPAVEVDKVHNDPTSGKLHRSIYTGFTNTKNGIIPTGVMAAAGTGALIVGAGIIGLVAMSRKKEEDEDE